MRIELTLTDGERVVTKVVVQIDATTKDFHEVADAIVNNLGLVKNSPYVKAMDVVRDIGIDEAATDAMFASAKEEIEREIEKENS